MSRVSAGHGCKGRDAARGVSVPNPHPPTGQVYGSGLARATSGAGVPEP